jgi:lysyl-tRNA synthetase class 1
MPTNQASTSTAWFDAVATRAIAHAEAAKGEGATVICASGISPSGPIHLGNLREVLTVHFVAEAIRRAGHDAVHIHSWDDFDRLRKLPAGVDDAWAEHVGRALADIPDPFGCHPSYADHYIAEFTESLAQMGVEPVAIRQAEAYRAGRYARGVRVAMQRRLEIFDVLARHQTPGRHEAPLETRRQQYYPLRPYCDRCGKDTTSVERFDDESGDFEYECGSCGFRGDGNVDGPMNAKLVWKVDWPMRWAFERVDFEPGGEDHSTPGGSFEVATELVRLFDWRPPEYVGYGFVGTAGRSKLSGSEGAVPLPRHALDIFEPAIVRWMYARRAPQKAFSIDLGKEVFRVYDEWDALSRRDAGDPGAAKERRIFDLAIQAGGRPVEHAELRLPFRMLAGAADITQGNTEQLIRIAHQHVPDLPRDTIAGLLGPRLERAITWALRYQPEDERVRIRDEFSSETYAQLDERTVEGIEILLARLGDDWTAEGLRTLVYSVPKILMGMPPDSPPTPEIKEAQRAFFSALYRLLVGSDTGPRLPTLFLSLGRERVARLLSPTGLAALAPR